MEDVPGNLFNDSVHNRRFVLQTRGMSVRYPRHWWEKVGQKKERRVGVYAIIRLMC